MSFFPEYFKTKVNQASSALVGAIAETDPAGITETQQNMIADRIREINGRLAELQITREAAAKAVAADEKAIHDALSAAEILLREGKDDKASVLANDVEARLKPRLDTDKKAIVEIDASIADFGKNLTVFEQKLSTSKNAAEAARREMDSAKLELEREKMREAESRRDAGLKSSLDSLDVAADAMSEAARKTRREAETARMNADSLHRTSGPQTDPDIEAALKQATGAPAPSSESIADRLARLKNAG